MKKFVKYLFLKKIVKKILPVLVSGILLIAVIGIAIESMVGAIFNKKLTFGNGLSGDASQIYTFYHEKGVEDLQIAAILGNMYQESRLDPSCIESNGEGIGICQWSFGRKVQYTSYYSSVQKPWNDLITQLEFSWMEYDEEASIESEFADYQWISDTYSKEDFESATTIEDATTIYCYGFERCGRDESQSKLHSVRIPQAQKYYDQIRTGRIGSVAVGEAAGVELSQRMNWLFPNGTPTSSGEAANYMVTITVPINDATGNETTSSITVHQALAEEVLAIFEEMQETGFKIHQLAGYGWRMMASGTGNLSHHSYGVAIDINWDENPAVYWGYSPDPNNEYYITPEIVNIWKAHGFYWGGDWSAAYYDPMHFSYTDH